jgi:Arm DNA-binding domain
LLYWLPAATWPLVNPDRKQGIILMKFTDATLAALAALEGQSEYFVWDESLPGFGARVRRLSTRFVIQYRITGNKTRRESLGDIRRISIADARKIAKRRFAQAEMGEDPAAAKARAKAEALAQQLTLGVTADRYLALKQSTLRPSTHQAATRYYTKHWGPLRNQPLTDITRAEVARILQELTLRHGRVSAARARSALSTLYVWSMKQGLAENNPAANTEDPAKGIPARERILNDDEIRTVWNACLPDDFGRIVKLLLLTGCRREEIGGLLWSEINMDTAS